MPIASEPSVVVIDDSPTVCRIVATILKREGYSVTWYLHPAQALHALLGGEIACPGLLFVDLLLPEIAGYDVIRRLRRVPNLARTPIIAMSGADRFFDPLRAYLAGANTYVVKPLLRQRLIDLATSFARVDG